MHKILRLKCGAITWTVELKKWYPSKFEDVNGCVCCCKKPENLEHFIMECEMFKELRAQTIQKFMGKRFLIPFLEKVIDDEKVFKEFAKYVEKATKIRAQILRYRYS